MIQFFFIELTDKGMDECRKYDCKQMNGGGEHQIFLKKNCFESCKKILAGRFRTLERKFSTFGLQVHLLLYFSGKIPSFVCVYFGLMKDSAGIFWKKGIIERE